MLTDSCGISKGVRPSGERLLCRTSVHFPNVACVVVEPSTNRKRIKKEMEYVPLVVTHLGV